MYLIALFLSFSATFLSLGIFLRWPALFPILDIPNERSLHIQTVPRIGGIALTIGIALGCLYFFEKPSMSIVFPVALLVATSIVDDIRRVAAKWRLLAQLCAATMFVVSQLQFTSLFAIPFFALAIIWMTNLYNFMDGSDGLAGGMAVIGFSIYGVAALIGGNANLAVVSFIIVGSAAAFLIYNFHPAKVFLGDAGSIPLGFAAASIGLLGWNWDIWAIWFPLLVFSPFIVDTSITLGKRCFRREKIWEAHKAHYYQRVVRMGWGHRRAALFEYVLMLCVGLSALTALNWTQLMQYLLIMIWAIVYLGLVCLVDRAWKQYQDAMSATS